MALATPDEPEITRRALFKERDKVYPKSIKGRFRKLKWTALILLLSIYYITPWIRWDRGPDAGRARRSLAKGILIPREVFRTL
jgi:hypothetical protein